MAEVPTMIRNEIEKFLYMAKCELAKLCNRHTNAQQSLRLIALSPVPIALRKNIKASLSACLMFEI